MPPLADLPPGRAAVLGRASQSGPVRAVAVDKKVDQTAAVAGPLAGHRLAQQSHRVQDVRRADVGTDCIGRRCRLDQRLEHGTHAPVKVCAQRLVRGIGRLRGRCEPGLGGDELGVPLGTVMSRLARARAALRDRLEPVPYPRAAPALEQRA